MKRGFTLVEMLITIGVIAIMFLIVVPEMSNVSRKTKENEYQRFLSDVFLSTEAYIQKNIENYPNLNYQNRKVYVYFDELLNSGYLKSTILDPKNDKSVKDEDFTVQVFVDENNQYKYKLYEEHYEPLFISTVAQSLLDNNTGYGNYTYMGGTYLKGVQESNYVWYNGFLWRIMGVNEDGTVRLITEENVTAISYGAANQGLLYETNEGYINDWLNEYFLSNLDSSKTDIIEESDWCLNTTTDSTSARQTCEGGTTFNASVGLITLDEFNLSGASSTNPTYYLVNSQYYWTLTPYSSANAWRVYSNDGANNDAVSLARGVRPVINVIANAVITGGNGSLSNAYILNQTSESKTGKLNEKVSSGEYVSLDGKTYRVVSKESNGTKLIYDGYYDETIAYGSDNTFTTSSGIGQKLNDDILTWLGNSEKIIETNWYQTSGFGYGTKYISIIEDTTNPIQAKVGLIRVGEMMSGQSVSILTKSNYWTMNKYTSTSRTWHVNPNGYVASNDVDTQEGVRPVIVVSDDTTISSGNGTLQKPYIID